jgi:hypothetical protein
MMMPWYRSYPVRIMPEARGPATRKPLRGSPDFSSRDSWRCRNPTEDRFPTFRPAAVCVAAGRGGGEAKAKAKAKAGEVRRREIRRRAGDGGRDAEVTCNWDHEPDGRRLSRSVPFRSGGPSEGFIRIRGLALPRPRRRACEAEGARALGRWGILGEGAQSPRSGRWSRFRFRRRERASQATALLVNCAHRLLPQMIELHPPRNSDRRSRMALGVPVLVVLPSGKRRIKSAPSRPPESRFLPGTLIPMPCAG